MTTATTTRSNMTGGNSVHRFLAHLQEHWPIVLLGLGMAWGLLAWVWGKLVVSPRQLEGCYTKVNAEQTIAHGRIEKSVKEVRDEVKALNKWLLDNWNGG